MRPRLVDHRVKSTLPYAITGNQRVGTQRRGQHPTMQPIIDTRDPDQCRPQHVPILDFLIDNNLELAEIMMILKPRSPTTDLNEHQARPAGAARMNNLVSSRNSIIFAPLHPI